MGYVASIPLSLPSKIEPFLERQGDIQLTGPAAKTAFGRDTGGFGGIQVI